VALLEIDLSHRFCLNLFHDASACGSLSQKLEEIGKKVNPLFSPKSTASGYEGGIRKDRKHDHHANVALERAEIAISTS
jgi:hypothetical protein